MTSPLEKCLVTLYDYLISLFQFQFVNSFMALFYTAFVLQDMDKLKEVLFINNDKNHLSVLISNKKTELSFIRLITQRRRHLPNTIGIAIAKLSSNNIWLSYFSFSVSICEFIYGPVLYRVCTAGHGQIKRGNFY